MSRLCHISEYIRKGRKNETCQLQNLTRRPCFVFIFHLFEGLVKFEYFMAKINNQIFNVNNITLNDKKRNYLI